MLKDVNFEALEPVRKKCISFKSDGNTVIKPYKTLYRLEDIITDFDRENIYVEVIEEKMEWEEPKFFIWEDLGVVCVKIGKIDGDFEFDAIKNAFEQYPYLAKEGFLNRLKDSEAKHFYINMLEIEVCSLLGENDLARHYLEYRNRLKEEREMAEQERRLEAEQKERAAEARHQEEVNKAVTEAETAIRNQQTLYNEPFENTTLILYLFKKHGVNMPIKTQGWINKALAKVWFKDGKITYSYYKSSKDSTVFYKYLCELHDKILQNV